jgi:hypothetical protein
MRALGRPLCNWQFEKCFLSNRPTMRCQFTNGCSNFAHKRCSILWSRTHGRNVDSVETIGRFCWEHYMYYSKEVLPSQTDNGTDCIWAWPNNERDHEWPKDDVMEFTANGLWFDPTVRRVSGRTNILPTVIKYVNTHGNHIDLTKQVTTYCSHHFAGIRASTTTSSTKRSSKRNYLWLPQWAKTWDA